MVAEKTAKKLYGATFLPHPTFQNYDAFDNFDSFFGNSF